LHLELAPEVFQGGEAAIFLRRVRDIARPNASFELIEANSFPLDSHYSLWFRLAAQDSMEGSKSVLGALQT